MLCSSCTLSRQDASAVTQASERQISEFALVPKFPFIVKGQRQAPAESASSPPHAGV